MARIALRQPQISTGLPRDFHGVTPTFPRGNAEISTALPQPADIPEFIARRERPVPELRVVALQAPITPILLCYDETGRKSSEIGEIKAYAESAHRYKNVFFLALRDATRCAFCGEDSNCSAPYPEFREFADQNSAVAKFAAR